MEKQIQTFVFFDLEATGLFNGTMPKITEMALVAVAREYLRTVSVPENGQNSPQNAFLPRILHKLVLPINPKKVIPSRVENLTSLYNDDMHLLQPFEVGTYELIIYFLNRLKPPICFVAHNGDKYDYPLFLSELSCINKTLDDTILCVDTLKMFRDYYKPNNASYTAREIEDMLNDGYNESLSIVLDSVMMEKTTVQNVALTCSLQSFPYEDKYNNGHGAYEKHTVDNSLENYNKHENNHRTPSQKTKQQDTANRPSKKSGYKRRLECEFECEKTGPANFKLSGIYQYMFPKLNVDLHSAEADCTAMLQCVTQVADYFLTWSDNNASPLAHYKKT